MAYSCKRRHFCPSCHQKRVVEYGEWLLSNVLKNVPHRQLVFSIPKRLRIYFLFDRKFYIDPSHFTPKIGSMIIDIVSGRKNPARGFGKLLDKKNVIEELKQQRKLYQEWAGDNRKLYALMKESTQWQKNSHNTRRFHKRAIPIVGK